MFIGCINYYREMWPSHAHILKPLTDHSGLKKHAPIPWTPDMQTAFNKMCILIVADALAAYMLIYIQLHLIINCQSHSKLYVMEKEMLSVVATLNKI
ncbi:hypothetical protein ACHAW6_003099 [Cyclotella cf. meneghiniana]